MREEMANLTVLLLRFTRFSRGVSAAPGPAL
jgi:hypothetical protein